MDTKRKISRQAEASPASAPAPATAPPSSRSDSATPFFPSSYFSKCVTLHDWWLIKSDTDSGGKRLAVGGLSAHGKYLTRAFTSVPIVKRHDAYTLETADGITVQIQGFINKNRTHDNGIPLEVLQCFLVGFPFNWEQYANGDFGEMSTSPSVSMRCSGIDKQRENSSDEFRVCVGKLLDSLTSGIDASMNDESRKNFDFAQRNPSFLSSVNTALRNLLSSSSFCSPVASHPVETSRSQEMDKSNANREIGVECPNLTGHDNVGNGLHDGVSGESSAIANDTVGHLPTDMEEKLNDESERSSVDVIVEGISNDLSPEKHHQQTSRPENCAVNCQNLAEIERLQDVSVSQDLPLRSDSVGKDSVSLAGKVTSPLVASSENCALKCQNHAEKARLQDICDPQDVPSRKDSVEKDSDAMAGKVSSPLVASFESSLLGAQRNKDNKSTPYSLLKSKTGSIGLSPNVSGRLHLKYERRLGDYVLRSQSCAERIRVHGIGDSKVSSVRKDTNRNETDSLSVNTDMALQTALRSSPNDMDRKLNDNHTSSAKPAVERASNSSVPTERDDSNNKHGRGRYSLRSRDHDKKIGVDNAGGPEGSVGRKDSKESHANSMFEKNLPFEPLIKAPNKKGKRYNLRSEAKNKRRSVTVKEKHTTLGVFKQCEQIHVQSLITDGRQESNLLSAKEANLKHHSKTPASPDVINKKGADYSERNNSLRSSRNESFKTPVQCSVKHANHSVHAVRDDSDKASDITGKRIEELPNDQDGNQSEPLTEAQLTKQKTRNESRQKTVQRPNYSKDRSITGITNMDGLTTPSKADLEVKSGLYKVIEKLYPSKEDRIKVDSQLVRFKKAQGMFGIDMAIATRDTKQPALWWESYGDECKELQVLAIGILSLTCSATGCERNWSVFDYLHSKRRNRLEQLKLNALVFVKYNLQLEMRQKMREAKGDTYDPICLSDMDSDDEWITEKEGACLPDDNTWMDIEEYFELEEGTSGPKKKKGKKRGSRLEPPMKKKLRQ